MTDLMLNNTLTRSKEAFRSREQGRVNLFTCGPSVYRRQHIGNYRSYLYEDVLHKFLQFQNYEVDRVINFTDVEDKAIAEANDKGVSLEELRAPVEQAFFRECEMLQIHLPDVIPRSSTSVESAVELVKILLQKGHAYWHDGEVFFDPLSYPGFGKLFGLDMSKWPEKRVRFRKDTYPGQRWNYGDFILWRKRRPEDGEVFWETQLGQGRPAWNIQDAGMIAKHLGFELDIHTGGVDNLYRHHDYTLAIMECASGKVLAPYWLHGEHVTVEGAKMSKSKGNVLYVEDLLDKGFYPRHLRFGLLYGAHYRDRIDVSTEELKKQARRLDSTREIAHGLLSGRIENENDEAGEDFAGSLRRAFEAKMADDLDYNGAFEAVVRELSRAAAADREGGLTERRRQELRAALCDVDRVLGVLGCG